jgi:hypothetical protein
MTGGMDTVQQIIGDFKQRKWDAKPFERMMEIAIKHPDELEDLIKTALHQLGRHVTFVDAALSYISSKDAFARLVDEALNTFEEQPENEIAESILQYCSFQFPELLHPHLTRLFELAPNGSSYVENYPWRNSGQKNLEYLKNVLTDNKLPSAKRNKAWRCLLETRHKEAMQYAMQQSQRADLGAPPANYLNEVGFLLEDGILKQLYADITYHLVFASDYRIDRRDWQMLHPTWHLSADEMLSSRFGGLSTGTCAVCRGKLHHLITLDDIPEGLGVTGLRGLELSTCLSCLGQEEPHLFYQHNKTGSPSNIYQRSEPRTPRFIAEPFQLTQVNLAKTPDRWHWQDWAVSNARENLNRLGGYPSWIQSSEFLDCPKCQKVMTFLMQLDSDLPLQNGSSWLWGSGGIGYVLWCDSCKISGYTWQCT